MDAVDFPLVLSLVVVVTGIVWLIDSLFFAKQRHRDDPDPLVVEYSKSFFPVLLLVFVLRSFLMEPFTIPSGSMIPTLMINDFILVNKFTYGLRLPVLGTKLVNISSPQRGDVMVFFPPNDSRYFIKRVIGLPGDEIRLVQNRLFINGKEMPQQFVMQHDADVVMLENLDGVVHKMQKQPGATTLGDYYAKVPEGHYFMMGDNRDNSSDSRVWGPVPEQNIVGKAFAIWMHWEGITGLPEFIRNGIIK